MRAGALSARVQGVTIMEVKEFGTGEADERLCRH